MTKDKKSWRKLIIMREKVNWDIKNERHEFLDKLLILIKNWSGKFPNIRDIFRTEEIECILLYAISGQRQGWSNYDESLFVDFMIHTGFKDEPIVKKDSKPSSRRTTLIHHAAKRKCLYFVPELFKIYDRFDVNYTDKRGYTHFHAACQFGCDDVVKKFLEFGQNPNCLVTRSGDSPLHLALYRPNKNVAELLLRSGADPNLVNEEGLAPLHIICQNCSDVDFLKLFFRICEETHQPLQIDAVDNLGKTSLHVAVSSGCRRMIEILLVKGANPNLANAKGSTSLHIICEKWYYIHYFVEPIFKISEGTHRPLQVDAVDNLGRTPLHCALAHSADEHKVNVQQWYLEENGIDSWSNNDRLVVWLLLENGADPNLAVNEDGFTPLHVICQRDQVYRDDDSVKTFFEENQKLGRTVRVDARDKLGRTPLELAVANVMPNEVESLLDHGADLSGFVFPDESQFVERSEPNEYDDIRYTTRLKLMRAARALIVLECLEKRGYQLAQSDVLTIMRVFDKRGYLAMSADLGERRFHNEELASIAKRQTMSPNLSLYDFLQLSHEEAEKRLTFTDYFRFANSNTWYEIPEVPCLACFAYLFEIMLGKFFREWALESFSLVTHNKLPILCCEIIVRQSKVRDLWCLFQAATGQN